MSEVISLGKDAHSRMTVEQAINSFKEAGFDSALIIGFNEDGDFIARSSFMSNKDVLWLLEVAKLDTMGA